MKLNIFFENGWAELGILAKNDFMNILAPNQPYADTTQMCTEKLIEDLKEMPTFISGFTEELKKTFLSLFEKNVNKKFIIIDDWIVNQRIREKYMEIVGYINEGKTYAEAREIITNKYKPVTENVQNV